MIGADGVHSTVRRLAFGPEERFVRHLGYYVAGWDVPNEWELTRDWLAYNVPGPDGQRRRRPPRPGPGVGAFVGVRVAGARLRPARPGRAAADPAGPLRRPRLADAHACWTPWTTRRDLYFDQICRVDISPWHRGRIALVGDAACGATIGGQGNGTAMVEAYALAGELAAGRRRSPGGVPALRGPGRRSSPSAPSRAATPPAGSWPRAPRTA